MKKKLLKALCLFIICAFANSLHAQNFALIKDINTSKDANPVHSINDVYVGWQNNSFFVYNPYKSGFAILKGVAYFAADDGLHGTELWRSDSTEAGTRMVKDINPGSASSSIQSITVCGDKIFFIADNIVYKSDGTEAGTVPVPGISYDGDVTTCLTPVGNTLYFFTHISRFWKTDGTEAGTSLIVDFRQTYSGTADWLGQLTNVNGTLFFTAGSGNQNTNGPELWKSDGTAAGTALVKDIYPGATSSMPLHLTAVNGKLYFSADDGTGTRLWVSDGSAAGTKPVINNTSVLLPPADFSDNIGIPKFTVINKVLYFKATATNTGYELYKYDALKPNAGISLVKDIVAGAGSSNPANLAAVDSTLYFSISGAAGNQQLWKSNGINNGTRLVKNMGTGVPDYFSNLTAANGKLLFSFFTAATGYELWSSDGTSAGTAMIKDIYPGVYGANPSGITYLKNGISLFSANDGIKGTELWRTNGKKAGTVLVKNINNTTTSSSNPILPLAASLNNRIYFPVYDPAYKNGYNGLYISDGTSAGTRLVKDINPGNVSQTSNFRVFKNNVYFSADSAGYNSVYKTDGTTAGTIQLFNTGRTNVRVAGIFAAKDYLYVFYNDLDSNNTQLWVSDGTTAGSKLLQVIALQSYYYGAAINNTLYFSGLDAAHGTELWKASSTPGSVKMVKDIYPGTQGSSVSKIAVLKNKLYFSAVDSGDYGRHIYVSDGTSAGTQKLFGTPTYGGDIIATGARLFFDAIDAAGGNELFVSDGTAAGTKLLKDIYPGINGSNPYYFTAMGAVVYFQANDNIHGAELWKSNGIASGTVLVKDIISGSFGSSPNSFTVANGQLYFSIRDNLYQPHLYVSNGKPAGTNEIADAGLSGVRIGNFIGGGDKLYINGYTYAYGSELYAGNAAGFAPVADDAVAKNIQKDKLLAAMVLGNPVQDKLSLSINNSKAQNAQVIITDASGKMFINKKEFLNAGPNQVAYPANTWIPGIYTIKIIAEDGSSADLKIVK